MAVAASSREGRSAGDELVVACAFLGKGDVEGAASRDGEEALVSKDIWEALGKSMAIWVVGVVGVVDVLFLGLSVEMRFASASWGSSLLNVSGSTAHVRLKAKGWHSFLLWDVRVKAVHDVYRII